MRDILNTKDNFILFTYIKSHLLYGDYNKCKNPTISVLMPVYQHPNYFKISLESVLQEDYQYEYEIVVVDNNDLAEDVNLNQKIVMESRAKNIFYYRNEKNIGMYGNWNRCIELARAPFVTYCHDDDVLLPNALSRLMDLQKKTKDKAIFSAFNKIDKDGNIISNYIWKKRKLFFLKSRDCYNYTLFNQFNSSAGFGVGCLFNRSNLIEIGGYDAEFYPSADYALQAHYTYRFGSVYNNIPTFNYRIAENTSLSVYNQFVEKDKHFRECMSKKLHYPKFILNRIIAARYNTSKIYFAVMWGKEDKSLYSSIRFSDKLILKIINILLAFKKYKIGI
jgi:glycosyltransferase involved in cell wall biosynthesis